MTVDINQCYIRVENTVTREIEGNLVIIPLNSGIGDLDTELFSLNHTGNVVWQKLDGQSSLKEIIDSITHEYEAPSEQIKHDIIALIHQLLEKNLIIKK